MDLQDLRDYINRDTVPDLKTFAKNNKERIKSNSSSYIAKKWTGYYLGALSELKPKLCIKSIMYKTDKSVWVDIANLVVDNNMPSRNTRVSSIASSSHIDTTSSTKRKLFKVAKTLQVNEVEFTPAPPCLFYDFNGVELSAEFFKFQELSYEIACSREMSLISDLSKLFPLSGILFVPECPEYDDLLSRTKLNKEVISSFNYHIKEKVYGGFNQELPDFFTKSIEIALKQFNKDLLEFKLTMLLLAKGTTDIADRRVIEAIISPAEEVTDFDVVVMSEMCLSCSFIHPVMKSLSQLVRQNQK